MTTANLTQQRTALQVELLKVEHEVTRCRNNLGAFKVRSNFGQPVADSQVIYEQQALKKAELAQFGLNNRIAALTRQITGVY